MGTSRHRFGDFVLDADNRTLVRDGDPVSLSGRYFDALALLVREHGRLVPKQRFFDEVWAPSVVTDAALTQCVKDIRRALGDDASDPRFVRTVAGHGYCFIAAVLEDVADGATVDTPPASARAVTPAPAVAIPPAPAVADRPPASDRPSAGGGTGVVSVLPGVLTDAVAAAAGGATAGLLGGVLYGSALAFSPQSQGLGTSSVLLVLLALNVFVGLAGGMGVGLGLAAGRSIDDGPAWTLAGATFGGFAVGGLVKVLGSDTFTLLVGHAPSGTTGGVEGAVIGFAVAAGLLAGGGPDARRGARPALFASIATGLAGTLVSVAGGSLMASSLSRVAAAFDESRLDLEPLGRWFGEPQFGAVTQAALGALEGGLFGGCVGAALLIVHRRSAPGRL